MQDASVNETTCEDLAACRACNSTARIFPVYLINYPDIIRMVRMRSKHEIHQHQALHPSYFFDFPHLSAQIGSMAGQCNTLVQRTYFRLLSTVHYICVQPVDEAQVLSAKEVAQRMKHADQ